MTEMIQSDKPGRIFPHAELPPIPLPPVRRVHRYCLGYTDSYGAHNKMLVERVIGRVLKVIRTDEVSLRQACAKIAAAEELTLARVLAIFNAYATDAEKEAADVGAAIWKRRWNMVKHLLVDAAERGQIFMDVCARVAKAENVGTLAIYKQIVHGDRMKVDDWELLYQYFPHVGAE